MRRGNMAGAMQYVPELTWILFLRILDETEAQDQDEAEALGIAFTPSLAVPYRWRDWAAPDGTQRKALEDGRSGGFFAFVNGQLLPHLKHLERRPGATVRQKMISEIMSSVERVRIDTECNFCDVLLEAVKKPNINKSMAYVWERPWPRLLAFISRASSLLQSTS